jgi:NAD(P)-dependent dehydrogenase (short-subunit alcohol dehydrogenase family)
MNVLITGASSGIGEAIARRLSLECKVIACGRNREKLQQLVTECGVTPLPFDVSVRAEVITSSEHVAELDWLILNAGTCEYIDEPSKFDSVLFERVIKANLLSIGYCLESLAPKLKSGGKLVVMSSSSVLLPLPRAEAYGASKAAVTYLAQTLAITRPDIDVIAVHPGFVTTPLTAKNDFPMPFEMSSSDAASRIIKGIKGGKRKIEFPKRLVWLMKCLACLPDSVWLKIARRMKN